MDPDYEPDDTETRTLYGLQLQQLRNNASVTKEMFNNLVTKKNKVRRCLGWINKVNNQI